MTIPAPRGPGATRLATPDATFSAVARTVRRPFALPRLASRSLSTVAEWGTAVIGALIVVLLLLDASADALRVTAVFLALAALVAGLSRRVWALGIACLVAAWWLAVVLGRYLPDLINPWPPVANTVGGGAYFGTPYQGPQIGAVLSVAIPIFLFVGAVLAPSAWAEIRTRHAGGSAPRDPVAATSTEPRQPSRTAAAATRPRFCG